MNRGQHHICSFTWNDIIYVCNTRTKKYTKQIFIKEIGWTISSSSQKEYQTAFDQWNMVFN